MMTDPFRATEWQPDGLCAEVDTEIFFPEKGGSTAEAKMICRRCEVRTECLDWALANDERFGVFGGLTTRQRRKEAKKRGIVIPAEPDADLDEVAA